MANKEVAETPGDDKAKGKKKAEKHKPRTPREQAIAFARWLWPIIVIVVIVFGLRSSLVDWNDVPSGSMRPTIIEGDRIFVNKLSYDLKVPFTLWRIAEWGDPQRGDIVIWLHPTEGNWMGKTRLVKRVIGLPGDVVEVRNDGPGGSTPYLTRIIINGKECTYAPAQPPASVPDEYVRGRDFYEEDLDGVKHLVAAVPWQIVARDAMGRPVENGIRRNFGPFTVPEGHYFLMGDNRDESRDSRYFDDIQYAVPRDHILGKATRVVFSLNENWLPRGDRFFHPMP